MHLKRVTTLPYESVDWIRSTSSSCMRVMTHNWSATKQHLHLQSVAKISRHSVLSGDGIRQCGTSSGSRHKDRSLSVNRHFLLHSPQCPCSVQEQVTEGVRMSKFGIMKLIFVDPGVMINSTYCCNVLLTEQLLTVVREISGEFLIFQREASTVHRACETVSRLDWQTPAIFSLELWAKLQKKLTICHKIIISSIISLP